MQQSKKKKWCLLSFILFLIVLPNIIAYNHAYKFTHFTTEPVLKTPGADKLSVSQKVKTLFAGVNNPRPETKKYPQQPFQTIKLQSNKQIEGWLIPVQNPRGTVILFHGYGGEKSSMLDKSTQFNRLGFTTFLIDFMGAGGSEGNQTTIGFHEAEQVKTSLAYIQKQQKGKVYLFGTSMGGVAILKAIVDFNLKPSGIIIECPFGSMYETTVARFRMLQVPPFPMAGLLVFWGGVQNNFWAFSHKPTEYAKAVSTPTLLLYGGRDPKVSAAEIADIYANLKGKKRLVIYPIAGHENYLNDYKQEWISDVGEFLNSY